MVQFEEITEIRERVVEVTDRIVFLPELTDYKKGSTEYLLWSMANNWMLNYSVHMDDEKEAESFFEAYLSMGQ